jgi:hypothetical protein
MRVDDDIRKCVVFVGLQMDDASYRFVGSAFWIGRNAPGDGRVYLVTARHVIDGIRSTGLDTVWMRLNHSDSTSKWLSSKVADWYVHPSDASIDVAILASPVPDGFDHRVFPYSRTVTPKFMVENEVGLGEEVFIVGLFRHRHGNHRNIPVVRVGNLATIGEERIASKKFGQMDANLIEVRSIGGLSGSPVFINLGSLRLIAGQIRIATGPMEYLFGLVHGHFDATRETAFDESSDEADEQINTGIAVVVPFHSVDVVIRSYEDEAGTSSE